MRITLTLLSLLAATALFAQNYEASGDAAFRAGDYSEAEVQYQAALALMESQKISVNAPEYLAVQKKLVKSQQLVSLWAKAESRIAAARQKETEGAYRLASDTYSMLLKANPNDIRAKERIKECNNWMAEKARADRAAQLAAVERSRRAAMAKVLSSRKIEDWDAHVASIPKARAQERDFATAVRRYLIDGFNEVSVDSIEVYNKMGDLFAEAGWGEKARDLYDCSASLADPEGLYKKAMASESKRGYDILCLILSSMSGYKPAVKELGKYDVVISDSSGLNDFYRWLSNYRTDSSAALSLYFAIEQLYSSDLFSHLELNLNEILKGMSRDQLKAWVEIEGAKTPEGQKTWAEYFLSLGLRYADSGESELALNLILVSSELGHEPAAEWLSKEQYWAANPPDFQTYLPLFESFNQSRSGSRIFEFLKYVKGDPSFDDLDVIHALQPYKEYESFPKSIYHNEALLLTVKRYLKNPTSKYSKQEFKEFIKDNKYKLFDDKVVSHCLELCDKSKDTKFGVNQLKKLATRPNLYDRSYLEGLKQYLLFQHYSDLRAEIIYLGAKPPRMTDISAADSFSFKDARNKKTASTPGRKSSMPSVAAQSPRLETYRFYYDYISVKNYYKENGDYKMAQRCYVDDSKLDHDEYQSPIEYTMKYEGDEIFLFTFTHQYRTYAVRGKLKDWRELTDIEIVSGEDLVSVSVSFKEIENNGRRAYKLSGSYTRKGYLTIYF